jgi:hypothetical protein
MDMEERLVADYEWAIFPAPFSNPLAPNADWYIYVIEAMRRRRPAKQVTQ